LCFNKTVLQSLVFQKFWSGVEYKSDVNTVIQEYETQLTSILSKAGFSYRAVLGALSPLHNPNVAALHPDICIKHNIPLIKVKYFLHFPMPQYITTLIQEKSDYPVSLMYDYFVEVYNPNDSLMARDHIILARAGTESKFPDIKIAIHLHVFYLDVFEKYIECFDNYSIDFDLFITTDTLDKKAQIASYLQGHKTDAKIKEIIVCENRGRDIIPWLSIEEKLSTYDIAGHFHTKKSVFAKEWIGITWQKELLDLLVCPINAIIEAFNANRNIGIIIPDIPHHLHINAPLSFYKEKPMQVIMDTLWEKMKCKKDIDFSELVTVIMPVGDMFWYRPAALRPLFKLQLSANDVPPEPLPINDTILHSIERMHVYIAWSEGYDYRIVMPEKPYISSFADNTVLNKQYKKLQTSIAEIKNSLTYRAGDIILFMPKTIKKLVKYFLQKK
jgi:rhamnosyltransferase